MRSDCIDAVTRAAGRALTAGELRDIEGRLLSAVRLNAREDRATIASQSPGERLQTAAERVAKDLQAEAERNARNVAAQIIAHDRNQQFIDTYGPKVGGAMNAVRRLLADNLDGKGNVRSLEQRRNGIARYYNGKIAPVVAATQQYLGFWTNKQAVRDVLRELYGEDSKNPAAKAAAKAWSDNVAEPLRQQFNAAGGAIRQLKNWAVPQSHSQVKAARAGLEKWTADVLPRLDREAYVNADGSLMNDAQVTEVLRQSYDSISTDGANQIQPGQHQGAGAIKNRGQDERVLHFANADAYMDYQAKYGERSLLETMTGHIQGMAKQIATLETFGPNGEAGFRQLLDTAYQADATARRESLGKLKGQLATTETQFMLSSGKMGAMGNPNLAHKFDIAKTLMVLPKLGSATLSAITDGSNMRAVARAWNIPAFKMWQASLKAWTSADFRQTMRANGVGVEAVTHAISRYGEETFGHGMPSAVANTLFRVSGLNFLDNVRRTGAGAMLMDKLGGLVSAHETMESMSAHDRQLLESRGVISSTWNIWRQAELSDGMLTPDAIGRIDGLSNGARRDALQHLVGTVFMDEGTVVPMMKDWARGSVQSVLGAAKRGTWGGELVNSILQFKSFPVAMMANHWQRLQSMPSPAGKILYAAELIASSTILGALSVQMKSLASGSNPQDMTDKKFAARAWIQGGSTGLLGDIIGNALVSPYKEHLTDMLGPVVSSASELYDLGRSAKEAATDPSKRNQFGDAAVRFAKNMTPFQNLWYTKQVTDHLIFQRLQDYYSPGYSQRSQQRAQTNFGSTPWWKPSTAAAPSQLLTGKGVTSPTVPNLNTATGNR